MNISCHECNKIGHKNIIINLSGRGDKDIHTVAEIEGIEF
jgi:tryptophan synthase beta subunit